MKDFQAKTIYKELWHKAFNKPDTSMKLDSADSEYFDKGIKAIWPFPTEKPTRHSNEPWPWPTSKGPDYPEAFGAVEVDPRGVANSEPGAKADAGKNRAWLCLAGFSNAIEEVAKVTTAGAKKYTDNGWVEVPDAEARYMDAATRHLLAYGQGKVYDDGPNGIYTKHLAQCIWNLLAVLELQERNEKDSDSY